MPKKQNKKDKKVSVIKNNLYFLGLLWKISPLYIILSFFIEFFGFAGWTFYGVFFIEYLFGTEIGSRSFMSTAIFIVAALLIDLSRELLFNWYYHIFLPKAEVKYHYKLNLMLFKKAQAVDLACYENPEFYNSYTKAANEASNRAYSVIETCAVVICSFLSSLFVIVKMATITFWSLLFVALPLIANLYFGKKLGKLHFNINEEATPDNRKMDYVNRIVYFRRYAGELRLTNIYSVLEKMFRTSADNWAGVSVKYAAKRSFYDVSKNILMFILGYKGMALCAAILALSGKIEIGAMIVLINAIVNVSWMMHDFEVYVSRLSTNAYFIGNLKGFFDFVPKIKENEGGKTPPKEVETLEFKNVSFKYEGQEKYALKNVSLIMKRGVRHALVGINGSGKTTLIKLIMRFYDATEGEILLNGINIKEFDIKKYRALIGAAFQDFALFSATVSENVLLKSIETQEENEIVLKALKDSDAYKKTETLPQKENTVLTKEFDNDGVELSGGERQKIAIARAFAKRSPIIILDEPSSALDPVAEYKMFETVTALCKGEDKLSVIVSHRLSSAAMCEKLFVFEAGELVEQGSHKELVAKNGIYSDMFLKQARNYTAGEVSALEE